MLAVTGLAAIERSMLARTLWECVGLAVAIVLPLVVLVGEVTADGWPRRRRRSAWARACALPAVAALVPGRAGALRRPRRRRAPAACRSAISARTRPGAICREEEFRTLVDAGSAQGQVDARERRLIHRVFEFSDKNVGQVMTPRDRIFALAYDLPMQRLVKEVAARGFSRVPIYQKSLDNVRGIVNAKDLVMFATGQMPAGAARRSAMSSTSRCSCRAPRRSSGCSCTFKQKKVHMAIVVSEYGKVLGARHDGRRARAALRRASATSATGLQSAVRRPRAQPGYMKTGRCR